LQSGLKLTGLIDQRGNDGLVPGATARPVGERSILTGQGPRADAFARVNRHSRNVRLMKVALPMTGVFLVAAFMGVTVFNRLGSGVTIEAAAIQEGRIVMQAPRLSGSAGDGRQYVVEAERALQDVTNPNSIELEKVKAAVPFGSGATADVSAASGHFDNGTRVLSINGDLNITTTDGMNAVLKDAVFNLGTESVKTAKPVKIEMKTATINAEALEVEQGGKILRFTGGVKLVMQANGLVSTPTESDQTQPAQPSANGAAVNNP
jgi:lipopolysaccharide export system protein LptC